MKFTRKSVVAQARLHHILQALMTVHYPNVGTSDWEGDGRRGSYFYSDMSGDLYCLCWDEDGVVGLVFGHESERSEYGVARQERDPLRYLEDLPPALEPLAREAADALDKLATAGFWVVEGGPARLSEELSASSAWAHGLEAFVGYGLSPEEAVAGRAIFQSWQELCSASDKHAALALRLAEVEAAKLGEADSEMLIDAGLIGRDRVPSLKAARRAAEMLAEVGVTWAVPEAALGAASKAEAERHKAAILEHMSAEAVALFDAVRAGDLDAVKELVEDGAPLNQQTIDGQFETWTAAGDTALIQAARNGAEECGVVLLDRGADPGRANEFGQTALHCAAESGMVTLAAILLRKGADPNAATHRDRQTPLHAAAMGGHLAVVDLLLRHGAKADAAMANGLRPRDIARNGDHWEMLERLVLG